MQVFDDRFQAESGLLTLLGNGWLFKKKFVVHHRKQRALYNPDIEGKCRKE